MLVRCLLCQCRYKIACSKVGCCSRHLEWSSGLWKFSGLATAYPFSNHNLSPPFNRSDSSKGFLFGRLQEIQKILEGVIMDGSQDFFQLTVLAKEGNRQLETNHQPLGIGWAHATFEFQDRDDFGLVIHQEGRLCGFLTWRMPTSKSLSVKVKKDPPLWPVERCFGVSATLQTFTQVFKMLHNVSISYGWIVCRVE